VGRRCAYLLPKRPSSSSYSSDRVARLIGSDLRDFNELFLTCLGAAGFWSTNKLSLNSSPTESDAFSVLAEVLRYLLLPVGSAPVKR